MTNGEEFFVILVRGIVPELMPHLAFRRVRHFNTAGKKNVKCPYCKKIFAAVDTAEKLELLRYPKNNDIPCDDYRACKHCREVVGIIYYAEAA
jgi:hypothetical protein